MIDVAGSEVYSCKCQSNGLFHIVHELFSHRFQIGAADGECVILGFIDHLHHHVRRICTGEWELRHAEIGVFEDDLSLIGDGELALRLLHLFLQRFSFRAVELGGFGDRNQFPVKPLLKGLLHEIHQAFRHVLSAQLSLASGGKHGEAVALGLHDTDVEGASSEVHHHHVCVFGASFEVVFVGSGDGFADGVDVFADVGFFGRALGFETLVLGEEGGDGHDEGFDGEFRLPLGQFSDILDEVARDACGGEGVVGEAAHSEARIVVIAGDDFGDAVLLVVLEVAGVELESDNALGAPHCVGVLPVVRIGPFSAGAHGSLGVVVDDRGDGMVSLLFADEGLFSIGVDDGAVVKGSGIN